MSGVRLAIIALAAMLIGCSQDPKYLATHAVWHPVSGDVCTALTGTANPLNGQALWDAAAVTFINNPAWHWGSLITPDARQALEGQGDLVLSFPASVPNPGASPFGNWAKVPAMREVMVQFVWRRREKPGEQRFKFYQG